MVVIFNKAILVYLEGDQVNSVLVKTCVVGYSSHVIVSTDEGCCMVAKTFVNCCWCE